MNIQRRTPISNKMMRMRTTVPIPMYMRMHSFESSRQVTFGFVVPRSAIASNLCVGHGDTVYEPVLRGLVTVTARAE